jgi:tetratricopeptide (TPR) repeat protein
MIYESGIGQENQIKNNEITGTGNGFGILLFHTYTRIEGHNTITGKKSGIVGWNNCQISMNGSNYSPYQIIHDNSQDELIFTHDSFPYSLHYNQIYDSDHSYDLLKCTDHGQSRFHNVEDNYWGVNFDPDQDFYPDDMFFDYTPQWVPGRGITEIADSLFTEAKQYEEEENYEAARQIYMDIIETYSENEYAVASAKELFALAAKDDQDYNSIQAYLDSLSFDEHAQGIIADLINYCEVGMNNYETAIEYYEDIITNPPSFQDSIFAVIDAGYTYLLMENNGRPGYVGQLPEFKPGSIEEFESQRDQLFLELMENPEGGSEENNIPAHVVLDNNYPNPFNPSTTISFSLPFDSEVELCIYNIKGQKVKTILADVMSKGKHSVVWSGEDNRGRKVSSGVYFYQIVVNGEFERMNKCLLLK